MRISIRDFRCFHSVNDIEIRPINVLVGENSAGKSSFMAAIRFLLDMMRGGSKASFNRDPFFLGSYDQIAHFRGGRFGRAKEFAFCIRGEIERNLISRSRMRRDPELFPALTAKQIPPAFQFEISFYNRRSQPAISTVKFDAGGFSFVADFSDGLKVTINTPSTENFVIFDRPQRGLIDPFNYELSYLDFVLRDLSFISRREHKNEPKITDRFISEVSLLSELYRSVNRSFPRDVYASAPVRSKPERTYNPAESSPSPGGEHIPFVLAQIQAFDKERWSEINHTLSEFGKASGLFQGVRIKRLSNTESGPFQIIVDLSGAKSNLIDVGYGVSQVLPIITDVLRAKHRTMFLFQQPEVHLHPKAQAELASFLAETVKRRGHTFFLETHSDYLLDRLRMEVRDHKRISPNDVSVLFFDRQGLDVEVHQMSIDDRGNLKNAPPNYREFFIREEMRSLRASD